MSVSLSGISQKVLSLLFTLSFNKSFFKIFNSSPIGTKIIKNRIDINIGDIILPSRKPNLVQRTLKGLKIFGLVKVIVIIIIFNNIIM
jgi:hypothetical protein